MIYLLHFFILVLLCLLSIWKKNSRIFISGSFFIMLFIYGQRWMVGTDYPNYVHYYLTDFQVREWGYRTLQNVFAHSQLSFVLLAFILLAITLYLNYHFLNNIQKNNILLIFLYLISEMFFAQMSQIRQYVAIAFFINSMFYSYKNEYLKSSLLFFLGLSFHISILIVLPFLIIKPKLNKQLALFVLCVAGILPFIDVALLLKLDIFSAYSHYLDGIYDVGLSAFHYLKFSILLLLGFVYVCDKNINKSREKDQLIVNGFLLNMLLYGLSIQFAPILRISAYFKIFEIAFLTYFISELKSFSKTYVKSFIIIFFASIFLGTAITDPYNLSHFQFRPLIIKENRSYSELYNEMSYFQQLYRGVIE